MLLKDFDKVKISMERIREFAPEPPVQYYLAFSGGKDSQVIHRLAIMAGVSFDAHFNITTVDPPELMQFIKENYPDVIFDKPRKSMRQLIIDHRSPPTRIRRFCCEELKERGGEGRFVITGIRAAESLKRKKRKMVENCHLTGKRMLHPIIDWTDQEVWDFLKKEKIETCHLYDEGFLRIGCIGCPMSGPDKMRYDFKRWPVYRQMYLNAFNEMLSAREKSGLKKYWASPSQVMAWWLKEIKMPNNIDRNLFELI